MQVVQSIEPLIRLNKNFVYKDKKYPIDFDLISKNSNYFYCHSKDFTHKTDIEISSDLIDLTESSILAFIKCCQNQSFEIIESDIFSIRQLAIKYEVPGLLKITTKFIDEHSSSLVFETIQYQIQMQNQNIKNDSKSCTQNEEKYIASHFSEFIDDERLLNLPVAVLYRIVNDDQFKFDQSNQDEFIGFLFKCLDKYKTEASILFLNLDLENQRIDLFKRLKNEYSDVFDFTMLNPKYLLKTTSDLLSEVIKLKNDLSMKDKEMSELIKEQKNLLETEKANQQILLGNIQNLIKSEIKKEHKLCEQKIQSNNDDIDNKIEKLKNELNYSNNNQINQLDSKYNSQFHTLNGLVDEVNQRNDELAILIGQLDSKYSYSSNQGYITLDI